MQMGNTSESFGWIAIAVHWLVAVAVFGLFGLGFYMVDLDYYHDWYRTAPHIHRSIGLILFAIMLFRVFWRLVSPIPRPLPSHSRMEVLGAKLGHLTLYALVFTAMTSGYLITTADGSSISVFGWFEVPSVTGRVRGMEDIAGLVHYWATWALVVVAVGHALAAIKHHFVDRDNTLRRMLGK